MPLMINLCCTTVRTNSVTVVTRFLAVQLGFEVRGTHCIYKSLAVSILIHSVSCSYLSMSAMHHNLLHRM